MRCRQLLRFQQQRIQMGVGVQEQRMSGREEADM